MRTRPGIKTFTFAALVLATSMGHGDGCCSSEAEILGPPTEAECPPTQTLSYENFGRTFMETYCTSCHSSQLTGADRQGATLNHDFDTLPGIVGVANHIDETAGIGPAAENRSMPPEGEPQPSDDDRRKLAEWIACDAPNTLP